MQSRSSALWRRTLLSLGFVALLLALRYGSVASRFEPIGILRVERPLIGTVWTIEVVDHHRLVQARRAVDHAFAELRRIDSLMSEWKPDSPLSQINKAAGESAVEVPQELRAILQRSIRYGEESDGTFEITWHGMAKIWHFDDAFVPPSQAAVDQARRNVNFRAIQIEGNRVFLPRAGMSIGLGGIAKGYAVDRAARILAESGFTDSLVNGGGDILASGTKNGEAWALGIQDPHKERGTKLGAVRVSNRAVVTSGDYERFRIVNGVRYHHIIDPRTGWPATESSSVTVIADTAERAVVLAKPIFILGPEKGLAFARAQGVDVLLIDPQGRRFLTDGFQHLMK